MKWIIRLLLLTIAVANLSACSPVPDCGSQKAQNMVQQDIYEEAASLLDEFGRGDAVRAMPDSALSLTSRDQVVMDMCDPESLIVINSEWLRRKLKPQIPEQYRDIDFSVYMALTNFGLLKRAISVSMTDVIRLSDIMENGRRYTNICRAKLLLQPGMTSGKR
ncbi:hypothetical protein [Paraburkholderia adhaesiva]|uniref:hypothetical protein n=1 Tax=Paraburkholderia adhaesiva TaxID=2883244 RepID=UPI001F4561E7|nr:hypothetical protein [Paraburkholderia adhaesiva]